MCNADIVYKLKSIVGDAVIKNSNFPKAYCTNKLEVKAIYLGCDPSNKHSNALPYAFALESGLKVFQPFINSHKENLEVIGLGWESVYVQNLCQNYFQEETSKNLRIWKKAAKEFWIAQLKEELDTQFEQNVPVLLTSQYLLEILGKGGIEKIKAPEFYNCSVDIPIPAEQNELGRPLIPMYRGKSPKLKISYHLKYQEWEPYKSKIVQFLNSNNSMANH